jgi:hypothetical protein
MVLARASYPYTWNQRQTSRARALCSAAASIPETSRYLYPTPRGGLGPGCACGYPGGQCETAGAVREHINTFYPLTDRSPRSEIDLQLCRRGQLLATAPALMAGTAFTGGRWARSSRGPCQKCGWLGAPGRDLEDLGCVLRGYLARDPKCGVWRGAHRCVPFACPLCVSRPLCVAPGGGPERAEWSCAGVGLAMLGSRTLFVFFLIVVVPAWGRKAAAHGVEDGVFFAQERAKEDDDESDRLNTHPDCPRKEDRAAELHECAAALQDATVRRRVLPVGQQKL